MQRPLTARVALSIIRTLFFALADRKRGIAQSGSAPALGAGCRGFKSLYPEC